MLPISTPDIAKMGRFFFTSFLGVFFLVKMKIIARHAIPTNPLTRAITLEGYGIYFRTIPIVPNTVMEMISFSLSECIVFKLFPPKYNFNNFNT